jgi:hypothetical protein
MAYPRPDILWNACSFCGRQWPFPRGASVPDEFACHICATAMYNRARRVIEHVGAIPGVRLDSLDGTLAAGHQEGEPSIVLDDPILPPPRQGEPAPAPTPEAPLPVIPPAVEDQLPDTPEPTEPGEGAPFPVEANERQ